MKAADATSVDVQVMGGPAAGGSASSRSRTRPSRCPGGGRPDPARRGSTRARREGRRPRGRDGYRGNDGQRSHDGNPGPGGNPGLRVNPGPDDDPGYQLNADALRWLPGDGEDRPVERTRLLDEGGLPAEVNRYFVECYRRFVGLNCVLEAREHTAQVTSEDRQDREDRFREGELPLLFCSPTMELGVDIAQLNLVNLRNVPPTPANYAQRSGRAGRGGQPALVFTYCAGRSPHDQYFYREPTRMVAGAVAPPRIDLRNRDLIRRGLLLVPVLRHGRLPAGLQLPPASDLRLGAGPARAHRARRVHLASPLPRHLGVRSPHPDLPRGRPLPGVQGQPRLRLRRDRGHAPPCHADHEAFFITRTTGWRYSAVTPMSSGWQTSDRSGYHF